MRVGIALRSAVVLITAASWGGCSSAPEASRDSRAADVRLSRDGRLRYVIPAGWFDATADSQAAGHAVWIIRDDYGSTLTIDEVHLDAAAQAAVREGGLEPLARLLMTLPSGERPIRVVGGPETFERTGRVYCGYDVEVDETRDRLRVLLFRADERVYASTLLVPAAAWKRGADGLLEVQAGFLGSVTLSSL
jgi:hypothetical protein